MNNLTNCRILTVSMLLLLCLFLSCGDENNPVDSNQPDPDPTRLYLVNDNKLSSSPPAGSGVTQHFIYSSVDWTTVLSCDMVGTKCTFGILFAVPPGQSMTAKADIIISKDSVESVIASQSFQVDSQTYTRYLESVTIADPACASGDILILRITKAANGSAGLGVMANTVDPNDSYIEVPNVEIIE